MSGSEQEFLLDSSRRARGRLPAERVFYGRALGTPFRYSRRVVAYWSEVFRVRGTGLTAINFLVFRGR
ncbi:hypothetical protein [Streptomyces sp. NPDC088196]|uniref:hypothetical protein n=1 Tax=Streptomyces sp. NPDC088196 TaxID=3154868 RepID=UPI00344E905C